MDRRGTRRTSPTQVLILDREPTVPNLLKVSLELNGVTDIITSVLRDEMSTVTEATKLLEINQPRVAIIKIIDRKDWSSFEPTITSPEAVSANTQFIFITNDKSFKDELSQINPSIKLFLMPTKPNEITDEVTRLLRINRETQEGTQEDEGGKPQKEK